jgi:hypothetical protein
MKRQDSEQFFKYTRMNLATFQKFCNLLRPYCRPKIQVTDNVSLEERVAVTLQ